MCAKRVSKELHDAFENDVDLDLSSESIVESVDTKGVEAGESATSKKRELIERIRPSEMIPDRFQPRPVLPIEIHRQFFAGEIDCYKAANMWNKLARSDKGHRKRVDELLDMAESVIEHGQIKPITGLWETKEDGSFVFRIETGERRFWGVCLKRVKDKEDEEPLLRVEVVEAPTVERQIIENRHAEPPTAVAQAREIAALLLKRMDIKPDPALVDPYEYFKQATDLPGRKRLPKGIWDEIEPVMQLTPRRMRQVLNVLHLPAEMLERADRYTVSDRVIQAILMEPEDRWGMLLDAAIEQGLTGEEMASLSGTSSKEALRKRKKSAKHRDHVWSGLRGLRGFSGAIARAGESRRIQVLDEMADEIVVQEDAARVLELLEELTALVRTRIRAQEEMEE